MDDLLAKMAEINAAGWRVFFIGQVPARAPHRRPEDADKTWWRVQVDRKDAAGKRYEELAECPDLIEAVDSVLFDIKQKRNEKKAELERVFMETTHTLVGLASQDLIKALQAATKLRRG